MYSTSYWYILLVCVLRGQSEPRIGTFSCPLDAMAHQDDYEDDQPVHRFPPQLENLQRQVEFARKNLEDLLKELHEIEVEGNELHLVEEMSGSADNFHAEMSVLTAVVNERNIVQQSEVREEHIREMLRGMTKDCKY